MPIALHQKLKKNYPQLDDKMIAILLKKMKQQKEKGKPINGKGALDRFVNSFIAGYNKALGKKPDPRQHKLKDGERHVIFKNNDGALVAGQFAGPGTDLIGNLESLLKSNDGNMSKALQKENFVSDADRIALLHDSRYALEGHDPDLVRRADQKMVEKLKDINDESWFNVQPAMKGIQAKMKLEDWGLLSKGSFAEAGAHTGLYSQEEIDLIQEVIDRMEMMGYGRSRPLRGGTRRSRPLNVMPTIYENPLPPLPPPPPLPEYSGLENPVLTEEKLKIYESILNGEMTPEQGGVLITHLESQFPRVPFALSHPSLYSSRHGGQGGGHHYIRDVARQAFREGFRGTGQRFSRSRLNRVAPAPDEQDQGVCQLCQYGVDEGRSLVRLTEQQQRDLGFTEPGRAFTQLCTECLRNRRDSIIRSNSPEHRQEINRRYVEQFIPISRIDAFHHALGLPAPQTHMPRPRRPTPVPINVESLPPDTINVYDAIEELNRVRTPAHRPVINENNVIMSHTAGSVNETQYNQLLQNFAPQPSNVFIGEYVQPRSFQEMMLSRQAQEDESQGGNGKKEELKRVGTEALQIASRLANLVKPKPSIRPTEPQPTGLTFEQKQQLDEMMAKAKQPLAWERHLAGNGFKEDAKKALKYGGASLATILASRALLNSLKKGTDVLHEVSQLIKMFGLSE